MNRTELKNWAKEKVKGKRWDILPAIIVAAIITGLSFRIPNGSTDANGTAQYYTVSLGWLFVFVEVGITYYMIKFINDEKPSFNEIFAYKNDFARDLGIGLLRTIFIFLWTLLLIIPGIMKAYSYALVPMLLGDEKHKELSATELLKKSEEMMKGHRMDLFVLQLSFIGWHILAAFTLFILELWIAPYLKTAETKFLYDVYTNAN